MRTLGTHQVQCAFNLGQVGVDEHLGANVGISGVPNTVEIVRHQINPVDIGHHVRHVEVLEIPIRSRSGKSDDAIFSAGSDSLSQLLQECRVFCPVV